MEKRDEYIFEKKSKYKIITFLNHYKVYISKKRSRKSSYSGQSSIPFGIKTRDPRSGKYLKVIRTTLN